MTPDYTEDNLVEQPTTALFERLGWETANAIGETAARRPVTGRDALNEVVLESRLRDVLEELNFVRGSTGVNSWPVTNTWSTIRSERIACILL